MARRSYDVCMLTAELAGEDFCYVTTTGRVTGNPHTIEIWFAVEGDSLFILAGGRERADWVRNIRKTPDVEVRITAVHFRARGRAVDADSTEDARARALVLAKYAPGNSGLEEWGRTALVVALDLAARVAT
jgi:deazaflavin-dependent oxidoreductase (nitroreductase family)